MSASDVPRGVTGREAIRDPLILGTLLLLGASATIAGAWAFELIGGYIPCPLCLQQRIPYYLAIPASALGLGVLAFAKGQRQAAILFGLCSLIFLAGAGLGLYHSGVEWGWWPGPASCGVAGGTGPATVGALLTELETKDVVACDEVQWRFLGLSFANYNGLISLALAAIGGMAARAAYGSSSESQ